MQDETMKGSGSTTSLWMTDTSWIEGRDAPADAAPDAVIDVVVVGAGLAGLTTAYLLRREGLSVAVLDDGAVGSGETSRTTAHLSNAIDDRYVEIERIFGADGARLAAESHGRAIARIGEIASAEGIDCDYRRIDGYLFLGKGGKGDQSDPDILDRERDAAHRAGLTAVAPVENPPVPALAGVPALRFPDQGAFHPLKYLNGIAAAFRRQGGRLVTGIRVTTVEEGDPTVLRTADGQSLRARFVVIATNSPFNNRIATHTKQAPYRTYVVGLPVPKGSVPDALYWDTLDPYHYVRIEPHDSGHDMLIVGGEDHKTGQADDMAERYARLADWARGIFPEAGEPALRWSGQVMETFDGLAFIGRNPGSSPNIFIATGDSGMGMTHGTIAGMLITDLIMGRDNPWAALYDPARKQTRTLGEFAKENLDVARQFGADWIGPGEVDDESEIPAGHGALLREGISAPVAVYRDPQGTVHRLSAVCPHLKCIVHWNPGEKTWDCPCHGSRFSALGTVLNGPAQSDLGPA